MYDRVLDMLRLPFKVEFDFFQQDMVLKNPPKIPLKEVDWFVALVPVIPKHPAVKVQTVLLEEILCVSQTHNNQTKVRKHFPFNISLRSSL